MDARPGQDRASLARHQGQLSRPYLPSSFSFSFPSRLPRCSVLTVSKRAPHNSTAAARCRRQSPHRAASWPAQVQVRIRGPPPPSSSPSPSRGWLSPASGPTGDSRTSRDRPSPRGPSGGSSAPLAGPGPISTFGRSTRNTVSDQTHPRSTVSLRTRLLGLQSPTVPEPSPRSPRAVSSPGKQLSCPPDLELEWLPY